MGTSLEGLNPPQDTPKPGPCCPQHPQAGCTPASPGGHRTGPTLPKRWPVPALTGQGDKMTVAKGPTAASLAAVPGTERDRGASHGDPGGTCPWPRTASAGAGVPHTVPTGSTAQSHELAETWLRLGRGLLGQRRPGWESINWASWYIPGAGAAGREPRGWARTQGASLQAGTRSPRPRTEHRCTQVG